MPAPDEDTHALLFASANASVHFALHCLEPVGLHLRAASSFVDPEGQPMHWHDFGDLEGPGWAANAIGGASLIARWARYLGEDALLDQALRMVDHVLHDGFVRPDGFIWPYALRGTGRDLAKRRFCLNYSHNNDWLCPGSLAKVGVQMLDLARFLAEGGEGPSQSAGLRRAAEGLGDWLSGHVPLLDSGWVPRRVTLEGDPYPLSPEGGRDAIYDHSADGLHLLALWLRLGRHSEARALAETFVSAGGYWGSINHDTYDDHENVAYAVAFGVLREAADMLGCPAWRKFAYDVALPAMAQFRMARDEHGVVTRGLFWMERSWDTAYLWENAEVAQAHLDAWLERGSADHRDVAIATLEAIAHHHYGTLGFLTEGIDWNNHISQRHHAEFAYYGAIRYTEPLLNNLHLVGPTLTYLESQSVAPPADTSLRASLSALATPASPRAGHNGATTRHRPYSFEPAPGRALLRLFYPAIATDDGVTAAIDFAHAANIDGVLLFEASYDTDPALLSLATLRVRFARLKALVPRFKQAGLDVHINVMLTMGHVDAGGGHPESFPFQFLVDAEGHVSRSTVCPLDPAFLDYVHQIYAWAAECEADAIWVDDDVRFLLHDIPGATCFCPLHLAAMAERTGRAWTREQLVAALIDDGAIASGLRRTWLELQASAIEGLAHRVSQAVRASTPDRAVPTIGLMSVGTAVHNAEGRRTDRLLRILSDSAPLLRPGSGFWHDWEPGAVLAKTEDVARQVVYLGKDVRVVAEIECHPYSPFQKSTRVLALELALNILAGTHDLSLNLFSSTMPFAGATSEAASFLASQKPFLEALALARLGKRRLGVGIEGREDVAERMRLTGRSLDELVEARPWELALSRMGIPVGAAYDAPHLWAGDVVYTDRYAITSALQDGVVFTPRAVQGLLAQGWGERLGIVAVSPAPPGANEVFGQDALNDGHTGVCLPVRHYATALSPHTWVFGHGLEPRVLSEWVDLEGNAVGPAVVALELLNGNRVGLLPFEISTVHPALLQPARRDQWAALLEWVGRRPLPARVLGGVNLVPQVFVGPGLDEILVAVANLSADDATQPRAAHLTAPLLFGRTVEMLRADGTWEQVTGCLNEANIDVAVPAWSVSALRAR